MACTAQEHCVLNKWNMVIFIFLHTRHHENRSMIWALVELIDGFIHSALNKDSFYAHLQ